MTILICSIALHRLLYLLKIQIYSFCIRLSAPVSNTVAAVGIIGSGHGLNGGVNVFPIHVMQSVGSIMMDRYPFAPPPYELHTDAALAVSLQ